MLACLTAVCLLLGRAEAGGIHIDELLEYTRIHLNDVRSVQFYTRDQDVGVSPPLRSLSCSGPGTISRIFRPI